MHVAMVTPAYPPMPGGGERYVAALARGIAAQGHRVTVVTSGAAAEADFWRGAPAARATRDGAVSVVRCGLRALPGGRNSLLLWRKGMVVLSALPGDQSGLLRRMAAAVPPITDLDAALAALVDVDVVHTFNVSWESAMVAAAGYAGRAGRPLVVTPFAHLGAGVGERVARNSTMDHQLRILRDADLLLVLTAAEREALAAYGIAPERVAVIGGGLDPLDESFHASPLLVGDRLPRTPFVLFVGRASYDKGAVHAAEAVLALRRQGCDVSLLLAGQSSPEFDRLLRGLGPAERESIRPFGVVSEADKHALLDRAALLALPSRVDSFGITLLEAWAHGKPVVAANAGGVRAVVDDGENGLLLPFGDVPALAAAMGALLDDPERRARLGENGRRKVQTTYAWDRVAERVLDHYQRLV